MRAMHRPRLLSASLILSIVGFGGCATRLSVDTLEKKVSDLERQNFELRKQLTEARVRQEIREESAGRGASSARTTSSRRTTSAETTVLDPRTPEIPQKAQVVYTEQLTPDDAATASRQASPAAGGSDASRLMTTASQQLDQKEPEAALSLFRQIVSQYPDDPLADDAQFGAAECYFQMGKYQEAIDEYRRVVNQFPFGDQVPFAFLKIAFAHLALEQPDLALDNFRNVSEAYPGTEAATVARQQIAHLSRPAAAGDGDKAATPKH